MSECGRNVGLNINDFEVQVIRDKAYWKMERRWKDKGNTHADRHERTNTSL